MFEKIKNFVSLSFVIASDRKARRHYRREGIQVATAVATVTMLLGMLSIAQFMFPSLAYFGASILKRIGGNDSSFIYELGWLLKDWLIETFDFAKFLSDCALTRTGKALQLTILIVAQVLFWVWFIVTCKFVIKFAHVTEELWLMKNRGTAKYLRRLHSFIEENKGTDISYAKLRKNRLYSVFKNEESVKKLEHAKKKRMFQEESRRTA